MTLRRGKIGEEGLDDAEVDEAQVLPLEPHRAQRAPHHAQHRVQLEGLGEVVLQTQSVDLTPTARPPSTLAQSAKQLLTLREDLRAEEDRLATERAELARRHLEPERVTVPRAKFESWLAEP